MTASTVDALRWKYNVIKPEAVITDTQPTHKDTHGQAGGRREGQTEATRPTASGQLIAMLLRTPTTVYLFQRIHTDEGRQQGVERSKEEEGRTRRSQPVRLLSSVATKKAPTRDDYVLSRA